jgi:hypothetical protein
MADTPWPEPAVLAAGSNVVLADVAMADLNRSAL